MEGSGEPKRLPMAWLIHITTTSHPEVIHSAALKRLMGDNCARWGHGNDDALPVCKGLTVLVKKEKAMAPLMIYSEYLIVKRERLDGRRERDRMKRTKISKSIETEY